MRDVTVDSSAERADLERLRGLLARWEQLWVDCDAVTVRYLRPGLSDAEMDAVTAPLGLILPVEVREWFRWHDGVNLIDGDSRSLCASAGGPGMQLRPLADCVRTTEYFRRGAQGAGAVDLDPEYVWSSSWFVLSVSLDGTPMMVETAVSGGAPAPIRVGDWADFEEQRRVRVASLTEVVATWVRLIEEGVYTYDPTIEVWRTDARRLSLKLALAGVY